jgi:hypothetical protein
MIYLHVLVYQLNCWNMLWSLLIQYTVFEKNIFVFVKKISWTLYKVKLRLCESRVKSKNVTVWRYAQWHQHLVRRHCTCQNCKIIGKVQMETTGMWGLTVIILKDIKYFQIWAYFKGIGINFNFDNFQNKIFPLSILGTIQRMHARYHRTFQHLSKIEDWFVYTSFSLKC